MNKKASNQIGIAIIVMALLLLAGGILFNPSGNNNYSTSLNANASNPNSYLFYLNSTGIGKQMHQITNYPNFILGSKQENNIIFEGNDFELNANPFTTVPFTFEVDVNNMTNANYFLLYFNLNRVAGNQNLEIFANGKLISRNQASNTQIPVKIYNKFNTSKINFTFEIQKPAWYSIFNWNKFKVSQLKLVEVSQNKNNDLRNFDFLINKNSLQKAYLDLSISCDQVVNVSAPIEVKVNNFIVSNSNPSCTSHFNDLTVQIPLDVLNSNGSNRVSFETKGFYKVGFSLNKIYYNDKQTYEFNVNNFSNVNDVIMHGDFDKDIIDVRINNYQLNLTRGQYLSILPYLKYGFNQIKFLDKPLTIKNFVIEKSTNVG